MVAVDAAVPGFFTYLIPQGMAVKVGQMVRVGFGRRDVVGYVMSLGSGGKPISFALKPILEILRPEPLFGEGFTEMVSFVSRYYLYPEGLAVKEILPGGIAPKLGKFVALTPAGAAKGPPAGEAGGRALPLLALRYPGGAPLGSFSDPRELREISDLVAKGLAAYSWEVVASGVGFGFEWLISEERDPPEAKRLGKSERDLLERLKGAPPTPLSHFRIFYKDALRVARSLRAKGLIAMERHELSRDDPTRAIRLPHGAVERLTPDQGRALSAIGGALESGAGGGFLLFGVTGSGKTEVYLRAADIALKAGRGVLWLAPEIALTMGLEARIKAGLPGLRMSVLHSALSQGERHDHWQNLERGVSRLALGARSAVFAPIRDLGLVIVDEEHDWAYKQEDGLRYHGRDLALWRARKDSAVIVLGSATPSLESFHGTTTGRLSLLVMGGRPGGATLPQITLNDRRNAPKGSRVLGPELKRELRGAFGRGEQALIFINRRGFSSIPICMSCGEALRCPYCSLSLTLHGPRAEEPSPDAECGELGGIPEGSVLVCHGCGFRGAHQDRCPSCGSGIVRYMGVGTEKLQALVEREFGAKGLRLDADSTRRKGGSKGILEAFGKREADFMVGTQMAAKGHDFANLTVVGVVDADIGLNLPDFRAAERSFQLLSQVSGRAGRADKPGKVIIQTLNPAHYALVAASAHDYMGFFQDELSIRESLSLPPLGRLALLRFSGVEEGDVSEAAGRAFQALDALVRKGDPGEFEILGPAPSPINKLKDRYRYQIMLRSKTVKARHQVLAAFLGPFRKALAKGFSKGLPKDKDKDKDKPKDKDKSKAKTKEKISLIVDVDPYHLL
jgi:primosomal protein N' (replication factor Y)